MRGFVEFEFDLPDALLTSLVDVFAHMEGAALVAVNVAEIPEAQGVYQLLLRDQIVYIGKTDAEAGLRKRLERHARTIQHRRNLHPAEVAFKAVRVFVFTAMDLEAQLIRHYGNVAPVPWNFSGFGSNDPGRERDTTNIRPEGFDALYPIDIDRDLDIVLPSTAQASTIITAMKDALPYTFRVEGQSRGSRRPHAEIESATVLLPTGPHSTRAVIDAIIRALPSGWQATALAGRVIMYRENREYPFGTVIARS
ncbi:GIY-YIG nuclease family protein [Methylocapsa sp. D3K7]|uniref:GIY-YIG nuclease family protein n=1 Tax=Methylocapsa sp. D3K7 TaxID=3041435 RepID=UPI00244EA68B|nr:GIY-YIG nuclease family protein [Methylocapsa sp. D3K7]WGJ14992.1 GIY-YIG nuclease family protein [Methylocapsa sp. D3K7]